MALLSNVKKMLLWQLAVSGLPLDHQLGTAAIVGPIATFGLCLEVECIVPTN